MPSQPMAGEVLPYVQGESPKGGTVVYRRLLNSPVTSPAGDRTEQGSEAVEPQSIPPYSLAADWLSKFHTWPEPIQALWLVAGSATLLGGCWLGFRAVREIVGLLVG